MPSVFDVLSVFVAYDSITEETISMYDYAGLVALGIFAGGIFFWVVLMFCAAMAAYRGLVAGLYRVLAALELAVKRGTRTAK